MVPLWPPVVSFAVLLEIDLLELVSTESAVQETIEIVATIIVAKNIFFILQKLKVGHSAPFANDSDKGFCLSALLSR